MLCCRARAAAPGDTPRCVYEPPEWVQDERERSALVVVRADKDFDSLEDEEVLEILRSQNFRMGKGLRALRERVEWLEKWRPNTILLDMVRPQVESGVYRMMGLDKRGRPIVWGRTVPFLYHLARTGTIEDKIPYAAWFYTHAKAMRPKGVDHVIKVVDLSGWKASTIKTVKHLKATVETEQKHFPGLAENVYFVNAGWVFHKAWGVISTFLNSAYRARIKFLSPKETNTFLATIIEKDVLPECYGGNAPMPPCPNFPGIENVMVHDEDPEEEEEEDTARVEAEN